MIRNWKEVSRKTAAKTRRRARRNAIDGGFLLLFIVVQFCWSIWVINESGLVFSKFAAWKLICSVIVHGEGGFMAFALCVGSADLLKQMKKGTVVEVEATVDKVIREKEKGNVEKYYYTVDYYHPGSEERQTLKNEDSDDPKKRHKVRDTVYLKAAVTDKKISFLEESFFEYSYGYLVVAMIAAVAFFKNSYGISSLYYNLVAGVVLLAATICTLFRALTERDWKLFLLVVAITGGALYFKVPQASVNAYEDLVEGPIEEWVRYETYSTRMRKSYVEYIRFEIDGEEQNLRINGSFCKYLNWDVGGSAAFTYYKRSGIIAHVEP